MTHTDVLISGGGIAGLSLAAALRHIGLRVTLVDPGVDPGGRGADLRSTAYLLPARQLFEEIGLWQNLAPVSTPLDALRVVDTRGWPPEPVETRTFQPQDLEAVSFGWNIPNDTARDVLLTYLKGQDGVDLRLGVGFKSALTRSAEVRATLSDGARIRCRLLVGADGRASPVREAAGIGVFTRRYGQKALAFTARHMEPHGSTSTEIYNQGGAFTTVPLPDQGGQPCSAIVWMNDGPRAKALAEMPPEAFNAEMTARAAGLLGRMERLEAANLWPVVTQTAERLTAERTVILAEAAHVLPPIGAQGLNTSLQDVRALLEAIRAAPKELGSAAQLGAYERVRAADTERRAQVIDLFNRVCQSGLGPVQDMRSLGLRFVHGAAPIRRAVMRAGMGNT